MEKSSENNHNHTRAARDPKRPSSPLYWATAKATTEASECESETLIDLLPAAARASPDNLT